MKQTWRWFGPHDTVTVNDMRQAGVEGVVTALHHLPNGQVWTRQEIQTRQQQIANSKTGQPTGLAWEVVESLPVSEEIKTQRGNWQAHLENYRVSLQNLAASGIHTVCYNFMPVLDWTRTELRYELGNGARCMRFCVVDFAAFDIHILQRSGARLDYPNALVELAAERFAEMDDNRKRELADNIVCGLPGAEQGYSLDELQAQLNLYASISEPVLRQHQLDFLEAVIPDAEKLGVRLCCHPDDPPFSLLGLPRIMSKEEDYRNLVETIDSPANGITLCSGSLGVSATNDLPGMMQRLGDKVHFVHLRNVMRETEGDKISFHEAEHLEGGTDMVALIQAILQEEQKRRTAGREDFSIPFRPDHGQEILGDQQVDSQPGYPAIGRLKGLAELRGIVTALSHPGIAG